MGIVYDQLLRFFTDDGWLCYRDGANILRTTCSGKNGTWNCIISTREEPPQVVMYSEFGLTVPPGKRGAVAEYLTRANDGLIIGNFEMNLDSGDVRYKTSVDAGDTAQLANLLRALVDANVHTMDTYWPGLLAIMYRNASPASAIRLAEVAGAAPGL